ncbi:hypothetical protein SO802_032096 [Lithocarpus litseifolius]|uniref:Uncharacterized protein n=1 Tax=Lithocarpus litseifolius TaxID=425828 RepID=A0AAW2BQM1_9ROSI
MPPHPHPKIASDFDIGDDKKRFISIVIFQAVRETYKKNDTRFSKANFLHLEHYEVNTLFPSDGFIKGCYVLGSAVVSREYQCSGRGACLCPIYTCNQKMQL